MLEDFFTKPLQGKAFKNFRDIIMNIDQQAGLVHRSVLGNDVPAQNVSAESAAIRRYGTDVRKTSGQCVHVPEPLTKIEGTKILPH
jgi:hypothetical protein